MRISLPALRKTLSVPIVVLAVALIATFALVYRGYPTADVKLNDGGVWVTRTADFAVGHLNYPSRTLDGLATVRTKDVDLLQDGNDVLTHDLRSGKLAVLDPATVAFKGEATLGVGSRVALRHHTAGVIDASNGGLYVLTTEQVPGFSATGRDPIADLGKGSAVTVDISGTVHAVSGKGEIVSFSPGQDGPSTQQLSGINDEAALQITAVGQTTVVLDSARGVLYLDGREVAVPETKEGRLQSASVTNDEVVIAAPSGLIEQPLDGSKATVTKVQDGGTPATPVWVAGCAYAVWSGTAGYVRRCASAEDDRNEVIQGAGSSPKLSLRQNRDVVVVNEIGAGIIWLADDSLTRVDDWRAVLPPPDDNGDEQSEDLRTAFALPKRGEKNHSPIARPDTFGARTGSVVVLPVLDNDTDEDGDLLTADLIGSTPPGITVQPVSSGAALQVKVDRNISPGTVTFRYRVDDGRERGTDDSDVTLRIAAAGENGAPSQHKIQTIRLEAGASADFDAMSGWVDPDGDDLYLKSATNDKGDRVVSRTNGMIQFIESTGELGIHEVALTVSDGTNDAAGLLRVDVRPKGSLAPVANADRANTVVGDKVTVSPLTNDMSASGKELRLAKLDDAQGARLTPDFDAGSFSFEASAPGIYYVQYLVTDGPNAAPGIVRVDVKPAGSSDLAPLASRDVALLMPAQSVLVDVLANDTDPAGGILVAQSVTVPNGAPVSVEVLEHRVLRIRDNGVDEPITIGYRVSNGLRWADGQVKVIPVGHPDDGAAPVTLPDRAVVRAGDIVTVDVTTNDYHPGGDSIELLPDLKEAPDPAEGVAFVSEGKVRFKAGDVDGTTAVVYEVADSKQHITAGYLRIQVVSTDAEHNEAPRPTSVTARTIAGTVVRIPVPLDGIDPDGDSVELLGTTTAAKKGRVSVGDSWFSYEAYPGATGRDSFSYLVRDRLGKTATGTVIVGIAAPSNQNQAPYAVRDAVTVLPGRSVSVPVLANDSDPDGDQVALVDRELAVPRGMTAEVVKSRILVQAPNAEGDYSVTYTAVDDFGARSLGTLVVTVSPDAPLQAPVARDDRVQPAQLGAGQGVDVPVVENDEDPDGVADQLRVTTTSPGAEPGPSGTLRVTPTPASQLVLYTVTDGDGLDATAAVFVPGTDSLLPTVKPMEPLEVVAGKELRIVLRDHITVRPGRTPRVADADSVRAAHSAGGSLVLDPVTLSYTADGDYYGPDGISVRVTDGEGPDDPDGNSAYLTLPIQVLPARNLPPTLTNSFVAVTPGDDPFDLNLSKLASDPNPEDATKLTFSVGEIPKGFAARVEGARLLVSADSKTEPGTKGELTVTVSDGTNPPEPGTVTVLATRSQRELPVAVDDVVPRAEQGRSVSVDVLRNDHNPFQADNMPLTVVGTKVIAGQGTAVVNGDKVEVTPNASFVGTIEATYRIRDATKAPDREAEATVRVTVQGAPDRVSKPLVLTVGDRMVVLQWAPPDNNGRPISGYRVSATGSDFSQKCPTTTCTLKGLVNNQEYRFQVVATNDIGDSDPSVSSEVARPDTRPDTPAAPKLTFGDKSLTVTWQTPHSSGSPVLSYNLEISPGPGAGAVQRTGVTGNRLVWTGLSNGTAYQVRVQAVNRAPEPSEWSHYSRPEVPAGPPSAPGRPTTQPATSVGSQAQISVSWPAVTGAASNGDEVGEYTLRISHGNSSRELSVSDTRQNITVDPSTSNYTFAVSATNKAGTSRWSQASAPRRAALPPGAPREVRAEPGDGQVRLRFTAGESNGSRTDEITYHYRINQTGSQGTISSGDSIRGLTNGRSYTFDVWATSSVAEVKAGNRATSNSVRPYGRPIISLDSIQPLDDGVRFRWRVDSNGSELTTEDPGLSGDRGDRTLSARPAESRTLNVRYANAAGNSTASWTGRANDPPRPRYWLTRSGDNVQYHYQNFRASDFSQVDRLRCWRYTRDGHPGGFATDGAGEMSFSAPAERSSGSIRVNCGSGVNDNYSVEPWRYGPWLNMNESVTR